MALSPAGSCLFKQGDFTLLEAVLIGSALIAEIEPDAERRTARLDAWQSEVLTVLPVPTEDEIKSNAATRETELKRRQALAFADWQAQTDPAQRAQPQAHAGNVARAAAGNAFVDNRRHDERNDQLKGGFQQFEQRRKNTLAPEVLDVNQQLFQKHPPFL